MTEKLTPLIGETPPMIGRDIYPLVKEIAPAARQWLEGLSAAWNTDMAAKLSFRFHHNSEIAYASVFGNDRPASAYFTLYQNTFMIEWGKIDPKGNGKLHDFLNKELGIFNRRGFGAVVRSGHVGNISLGKDSVRIGLVDSLVSDCPKAKDTPEYAMIASMLTQKILPVTSDGFPAVLHAAAKDFWPQPISTQLRKWPKKTEFLRAASGLAETTERAALYDRARGVQQSLEEKGVIVSFGTAVQHVSEISS